MSDTIASPPVEGGEETSAASGQRRLLFVVAGLAGLLVLALAAYFLFLSGGPAEEDLGVVQGAPAPTHNGSDKQDKQDKQDKNDDTVPDKVDDDFRVGRDPFKPLPQEAEKVVPVEDTSTDTGTGTGTNTQPTPQPTVNPSPSPSPTPTDTPEPVTSYKVTLKSVDVNKGKATIEVNGKRYVVKEGALFTSSKTGPFKLVRIGELPSGKDTATVRFGSDAPVELVQKDKTVFEL
jgi:hypothetical protein